MEMYRVVAVKFLKETLLFGVLTFQLLWRPWWLSFDSSDSCHVTQEKFLNVRTVKFGSVELWKQLKSVIPQKKNYLVFYTFWPLVSEFWQFWQLSRDSKKSMKEFLNVKTVKFLMNSPKKSLDNEVCPPEGVKFTSYTPRQLLWLLLFWQLITRLFDILW